MRFDVAKLKLEPIDYIINASLADFDLEDCDVKFEGRITGNIRVTSLGKNVLVRGTLKAKAMLECIHCLETYPHELKVELDMLFTKKAHERREQEDISPEEEDVFFYDGSTLDLTKDIRDTILLDIPNFPSCSENCKGLCPGCGKNLNTEKCACKKEKKKVEIKEEEQPLAPWQKQLLELKKNKK